MLSIGKQNFQTDIIYNIGNIGEKFDELNIKSLDIKEIVLWGSEGIDFLIGNRNYGIILKDKKELQNIVKFILENNEELKCTEIKDREKILNI